MHYGAKKLNCRASQPYANKAEPECISACSNEDDGTNASTQPGKIANMMKQGKRKVANELLSAVRALLPQLLLWPCKEVPSSILAQAR